MYITASENNGSQYILKGQYLVDSRTTNIIDESRKVARNMMVGHIKVIF